MAHTTALEPGARQPTGHSVIDWLAQALAVAGGLLLLATALLVATSVLGRWLFAAPVSGDFELVQMTTAIAAFAFLPQCQLRHGNIAVDTFTGWLPPRACALIDAFWDLVYAGIIALISVSLFRGTGDLFSNGTTTMMLGLVIWPAVALCAVLAGFLALAAVVSAIRLVRHPS